MQRTPINERFAESHSAEAVLIIFWSRSAEISPAAGAQSAIIAGADLGRL